MTNIKNTQTRQINKLFTYLGNLTPIRTHSLTLYTYDRPYLPIELVGDVGSGETDGLIEFTNSGVKIHVATLRPLSAILTTAAHEYRHAWQSEQGHLKTKKRFALELDAMAFANSTVKEYCAQNNIPRS